MRFHSLLLHVVIGSHSLLPLLVLADDEPHEGDINQTTSALKLGECTGVPSSILPCNGLSALRGSLDNPKIYDRALSSAEISVEFMR